MRDPKLVAVVISTSQKFTIFGWTSDPFDAPVMVLYDSVCVGFWSKETKTLWGLAAAGPAEGCLFSDVCPRSVHRDVLFVLEVSKPAISKFQSYGCVL